jgi:basic membrane protein A and related proteins
MRDRLVVILLACLAGVAAACAGSQPTEIQSATPSATSAAVASRPPSAAPSATPLPPSCALPLQVGLVTDVGTVNDQGMNQSAHEGMLAAAEVAPGCFEIEVAETAKASDFAANIARLTEDGDIVVGVGLPMSDALGDAAKEHTDMTFISVDGVPSLGHDVTWQANGVSLLFAEDQVGYLAGVLAASVSDTDHVGVVAGPVFIPPMERYVEGFVDGARSVDPDIVVDTAYATSLSEPGEGKSMALPMTQAGADVIFGVGGTTGHGALEAACDAKALAIGAETDEYLSLPALRPCILSSAMKDVEQSVRDALLRVARGETIAGVNLQDASTGGIRLAPFRDRDPDVSPAVRSRVEAAMTGLADGSIVPNVTIDLQ